MNLRWSIGYSVGFFLKIKVWRVLSDALKMPSLPGSWESLNPSTNPEYDGSSRGGPVWRQGDGWPGQTSAQHLHPRVVQWDHLLWQVLLLQGLQHPWLGQDGAGLPAAHRDPAPSGHTRGKRLSPLWLRLHSSGLQPQTGWSHLHHDCISLLTLIIFDRQKREDLIRSIHLKKVSNGQW